MSVNHGKVSAETERRGTLATRLRRYFAIVLVLATLCIGAWVEREALLRGAADFGLYPIQSHPQMLLLYLAAG